MPLCEETGVETRGLDLATLLDDPWHVFQLKTLLAEHRVVLLRRQQLSPDALYRLAGLWGPLMDVRQVGNGARHVPGHDRIKVISNARDEEGRRVGDGNTAEQIWHVDASYWEAPPGVTLFYARRTPDPAPRTALVMASRPSGFIIT